MQPTKIQSPCGPFMELPFLFLKGIMDTPNECVGHNYDCDVLELIVLDLRASQAKKIAAELRSCGRTLDDLRHWTSSEVSAFLKDVFPQAPGKQVKNMLKLLQPVLQHGSAPSPLPNVLQKLTLDFKSSCQVGNHTLASFPTSPPSPPTSLPPLVTPTGLGTQDSKAAEHRAAIAMAHRVCASSLVRCGCSTCFHTLPVVAQRPIRFGLCCSLTSDLVQ